MPNSPENPLASVDSESLDELFVRDPLSLTEPDIDRITLQLIKGFRIEREVWETEKAKAKLSGKKVSGASTKKKQKQAVLESIKSGPAKIDLGAIMKT